MQDFIKENYTRVEGFGENRYNVYLFGGEENIVYLAGKKGLHRHVIGGSSVEQIIDGSQFIVRRSVTFNRACGNA